MHCTENEELSLQAVPFTTSPGEAFAPVTRTWQGIPAIERTAAGTLFAAWYSGGINECGRNYVTLSLSDDDGATWQEPALVINPPGRVRAYDPMLWIDPRGRLWFFWSQCYAALDRAQNYDGRAGVWASCCDAPDTDPLQWSPPRRLWHGVAMNKPIVTSWGAWILPAAIWETRVPQRPEFDGMRNSNMLVSVDEGANWEVLDGPDVPERVFDEHMVVERNDGSLWMLVRTLYGVGQGISTDRGKTWSLGRPTDWFGPNSRFYIGRLASGRLLRINHQTNRTRSHLAADLSEDDGVTWIGGLLLDERKSVSYPDAVQAENGRIYAIHDHDRFGTAEVLMSVFTEDAILAGAPQSDTRLLVAISRLSDS